MTKEEFKLKYKTIYDSYKKQLTNYHNFNLTNINNPMSYFGLYLKFMRDFYLITTPETDNSEETNIKISSIMTAVEAYNKYNICVDALKNSTLSQEEIDKLKKDKQYLFEQFWKLVALNMEE